MQLQDLGTHLRQICFQNAPASSFGSPSNHRLNRSKRLRAAGAGCKGCPWLRSRSSRIAPFTPRKLQLTAHQRQEQEFGSTDDGPSVHQLQEPAGPDTRDSKQQLKPTIDDRLDAMTSSDEPQPDPHKNLHPLQRIALSFLGKLAAMAPPWLRTLVAPPFARRMVVLGLCFAVGAAMSLGAHLGGSRRGITGTKRPQEVVYSDFVRLVESGNVRAARFEEGSSARITFDLYPHSSQLGGHMPQPPAAAAASGAAAASSSGSSSAVEAASTASTSIAGSGMAKVALRGKGTKPRQFYTNRVGGQASEAALLQMLLASGVEFGVVKASLTASFIRILVSVLALWIPLIPLMLFMRRMLDERTGGGRKKKSKSDKAVPRTTFADVAGVGPAKEELEEVVSCLRNAGKYERLGAKMPGGVLLCGPPGTGKTLLARAVAGEAGVPFLAASASEFIELFVGRGAARIRELFAEARQKAPCVVFIDELDAVGGKRGIGLNEERDQTLNQLLTELDGFEGRPGVLLLAATNRPDVLDEALVRPGRLSRKVVVPLPNEAGRAEILAVHLRGVPLAEDPDRVCTVLAKATAGFSGAELANVVNEAALLSARRALEAVSFPELLEAVQRTRYGVNGGQAALPMAAGLQKKLTSWLVDISGSNQSVRSQPLGP